MDNAQHFSLPRLNEPPPAFNVRTTHGERPLADYRDKSLILVSRPSIRVPPSPGRCARPSSSAPFASFFAPW